ncbi:L-cystine transport system permease protein tcyL [Slackia heliotrinireducens]|uniref:Amino acid ABC transporter membrane protein n=1 Tax=Slackia heliotrinireducens (strain ATCC 29202 / DSM 20476 / NCTC 11029 / RHS 1) TaxID=471855 RepID=C7N2B8_SLAHD|nr:amino acid ABC transporter permease [Slackia heliotrinireducens]ACV21424.1 amino acid ABC transporter membrane protein [Slackia heliotrinireducens DSM 20476]VEG98861.1 L-cystine transport system permease protein tcyL [Slackia heliotrinireducens]
MEGFFSIGRLVGNIPALLKSLPVTFEIVAVATLFGVALAILLALARIKKVPVLSQLALVFISFIRGTPLLVQMFIVYYGMPILLWNVFRVDVNGWQRLTFVMITYSLNQGGFMAEIFRSAIESVPASQTEAAYSVGLSGAQTFLRIVLPQAVRTAIPSFSVNLVSLFQDTSLAFMLGVVDVMGRAELIQSATHHVLECYVIITVIFIVISIALRMFFIYLDKRLQYGRTV